MLITNILRYVLFKPRSTDHHLASDLRGTDPPFATKGSNGLCWMFHHPDQSQINRCRPCVKERVGILIIDGSIYGHVLFLVFFIRLPNAVLIRGSQASQVAAI